MGKEIKAEAWIASFFACVFAVLLVLAGTAYLIDPFFQFRVRDNTYFVTDIYVNAGLIKNYDYDTLIVGSCMIGNYDMESWRNELGGAPLKVESGGMSPGSIAANIQKAATRGTAKKYYINLDIAKFSDNWNVGHEYLLRDDILSRGKYLLGYETWFRYIPVDLGLMLLKTVRGEFSEKFLQRTSIDYNGDWSIGSEFGEEIVWKNYLNSSQSPCVLSGEPETACERMLHNVDRFISEIDFENGEYIAIFPPYSALFWCITQDDSNLESYFIVKKCLVEQLSENGCTVYDFQDAELITNLDHYMDAVHYSPDVNAYMLECFASGEHIVTPENYDEHCDNLIYLMERFRHDYADRVAAKR